MIGYTPDGSTPSPTFTVTPPAGGWGRLDPRLLTGCWVLTRSGCSVNAVGPFASQDEAQAAGEAWVRKLDRQAAERERHSTTRRLLDRIRNGTLDEKHDDQLPF